MRKTKVASEFRIVDGRFFIGEDEQCDVDTVKFQTMIEQKAIKAIRVQSIGYIPSVRYFNGQGWDERDINMEMTIRGEWRNGKKCWYAYRKRGGVLMKRYIGYSLDVTFQNLVKVANKFPN